MQQDVLSAARRRGFITPRVLRCMLGLTAVPIYFVARSAPSLLEVIAFAWLIALVITAYFALDQARSEAEHARAAKIRFLATMSHELRTPLNAIIGFAEVLMMDDALPPNAKRQQDYARLINESGRHLLSVVNGMLDRSKIQSGDFEATPEPFAPERVLENCCDLFALKAREAGIEIVAHLPGDLKEVVADKRSLNQIMINLLSNAIKFTDRGGTIVVSAKVDGRFLAVTVEDNGRGIDAEDLPRVGNPYFQARSAHDRHRDGSGLGLSIVKGLVAFHGGDMEIASRLGEGTRVTIRLPLDCQTPCKDAPPSTQNRSLERRPTNLRMAG